MKHSIYRIKFLILALSNILSVFYVEAQDVHYSQFFNSPIFLNPALTGNYEANWRIMNSYRQQWTSISPPMYSNTLGYDQQMIVGEDKLSAGTLLIYDKSSDLQFTAAKLFLSFAYHKKLKQNAYLSWGIQPLFSFKTFSTSNLTLPDQFNNTTGFFDSSLPTQDAAFSRQVSNINLNTGINYRKISGKIQPQIGLSLFNIIPSKESFYNYNNRAVKRWTTNIACTFEIKQEYFITPNIQYMLQEKASSLVSGLNVGRYLPENQAGLKFVYAGIYSRIGFNRITDAFCPMVGARIKKLDVGISYDINTSSLKNATNYRGAFEISIIYTNWPQLLNKITPNCERM